jgi:hypothetical protein
MGFTAQRIDMAKHNLYDETPSLAHDEEGKVKVKKAAKKEAEPGPMMSDAEGLDKLIEDHKKAEAAYEASKAKLFNRNKKEEKGAK